MRNRSLNFAAQVLLAATLGAFARPGFAQDELPPAPAPDTGGAAASAPTAEGILRDPEGIRGIKPFWESLSEGDRAYLAQDLDAAIHAYRQAIIHEPKNPLGHYRLGEAQAKKEDFTAAEEAWQAGLRFVTKEADVKAKLHFCLADLRERSKNYADASKAWGLYAQAATPKNAKGHPATATERQKRIADHDRLKREYGAVKARIEQRLKEADAASKKR